MTKKWYEELANSLTYYGDKKTENVRVSVSPFGEYHLWPTYSESKSSLSDYVCVPHGSTKKEKENAKYYEKFERVHKGFSFLCLNVSWTVTERIEA
jgi:hypothetical protein